MIKQRNLHALTRYIALSVSGVVLVLMLIAWRIFAGQLERDRECRDGVRWTVGRIEALRRRLGRLPTTKELGPSDYRYWLVAYEPWSSAPARLRKLGARDEEDYLLEFWRSERMIYFYSWTKDNTCESGAWKAAALFYALTAPSCACLIAYGLRRRRSL